MPDGIGPGDAMNIMVGEQEFTITVPDGVFAGMTLEVDLPVDEEPPPGAGPSEPPQSVEVVIPDGCYPGMEFTVTFEGREFNIAVPDGCNPGDPIIVEVWRRES